MLLASLLLNRLIMPKTVLFYRDFRAFSGGHLKVSDYFSHVRSSPACRAAIYMAPQSLADHPWKDDSGIVTDFAPEKADVLVLGGTDWDAMPDGIEDKVPVVNIIQHLRHADPADERHAFLKRKAHRICVSQEVADALIADGSSNGPIHTIANGIDLAAIPDVKSKTVDVFIAGLKAKDLAKAVAARLSGLKLTIDCLTAPVPRAEFLRRMAAARIAVTLPHATEGFFLPALEAMAAGCSVVCTDAGGNRSFCIDGETCLVPEARPEAIEAAIRRLLGDDDLCRRLSKSGKAMAQSHGLAAERKAVLAILNGISPRNIILTGLPRSGSTLTCNLLNSIQNVVALHEPITPQELAGTATDDFIRRIVAFFDRQRHRILTEGRATSKAAEGKVPQNPLGDERHDGKRKPVLNSREIIVSNVDRRAFDLCIKQPAMFTARLPELVEVFDCYATVRNPLSVLLSWRDSGMAVADGRAPAAEAADADLAAKLDAAPDVLDRQLILLDYFCARYRDYLPGRTIRYEDVVASGGAALSAIVPAAAKLGEPFSSRNKLNLERDPDARRIAKVLLAHDNSCWAFYKKSDVEALLES